ncbi:hypothetical protein B0J13DRAFT_525507 [Dactylonectria estremocensis]|uniref:Inositol monophosphatase n=1 Tax=Dactylonectria estremocensis TaxID=1079267 RepID=A0A9P9ETL5_9HYPO|nr:hypothetical protein B0J13DRAFT_525507 [Dactylonectria estremocensis]
MRKIDARAFPVPLKDPLWWSTTMSRDIKAEAADMVTQTDQAVESLIRQRLTERYPAFDITDRPTFIVDLIDGTSNFVHGFPAVCVSIGFVIEKVPTVGVVYNLFQEQVWSAVRGQGAFFRQFDGHLQRLPLVAGPLEGLKSACVGIEWGSDRAGPNFDLNVKVLARTTGTGGAFVNSLRCIGSAAIAICRVVAGQ